MLQVVSAIATLMAGPLADRVFEPAMQSNGWFPALFSPVVGTGARAGIALLVGINDCKLKAGFRQVFGTTVFGYLHNCRMERSRQLLEAGEMTVTEAAQAVGFVSRGHFAAAFKRRFGVNPSVYIAHKW
jgi:AraC-like DNA-binding protein